MKMTKSRIYQNVTICSVAVVVRVCVRESLCLYYHCAFLCAVHFDEENCKITKRRGCIFDSLFDCFAALSLLHHNGNNNNNKDNPMRSLPARGTRPSLHASREVMAVMQQISNAFETGLSEESLRAILKLLESGVAPETIVTIVGELEKRQRKQS